MKDLKSCPFCGGKATLDKVHERYGGDGSYCNWIIYCNSCGAQIIKPADTFYGRKSYKIEEIIEAWNKRVDKEYE